MGSVKENEKREPGSPAHARSTEYVIDAKSDDLYDREMQFVAAPFISIVPPNPIRTAGRHPPSATKQTFCCACRPEMAGHCPSTRFL